MVFFWGSAILYPIARGIYQMSNSGVTGLPEIQTPCLRRGNKGFIGDQVHSNQETVEKCSWSETIIRGSNGGKVATHGTDGTFEPMGHYIKITKLSN